ncbi:MAG TPA: twin-arginine translocation signal domain-containing protein, partial [Candidatus Avipropionibacterium avicola]|nr:twin-arginine translocation signal domain-containing protein [Candidatus Avipropionibacterium avicola]
MSNEWLINRRNLLRGSVAAAAVVGVGGLGACATGGPVGGGNEETEQPEGPMDPENPFGVEESGKLDVIVFNGGYGIDYVKFAAEKMNEKFPDIKISVKPSTDIAGEMQPRLVGGTPPDLLDNSGAKSIG